MLFRARVVLAAAIATVVLTGTTSACEWREASDQDIALQIVEGQCAIRDLLSSEALKLDGEILYVAASIVVEPGAALTLSGSAAAEVRLRSDSTGFANIIAQGALLRIEDISISSYNPADGKPDTVLQDGRAFIRVESFLKLDGTAAHGRLEVTRSKISFLGYDSRFEGPDGTSTYGLSLKVLSEKHLRLVSTTGFIRSSVVHDNYRGFYSYGASNFLIEDSKFFRNLEYGVDGHDDTDRLTVRRNEIFENGGTGLICSRRCQANVFVENRIYGNGVNGIMLHDLSNKGVIEDNIVQNNRGDGIVVHDSHAVTIKDNDISGNRIGIRVFAGSVATKVVGNRLSGSGQYEISLLQGNTAPLHSQDDLSDHSLWNGLNLGRHNDSRVWFTVVENNVFFGDASIRISGAQGSVFRKNRFFGDQSFRISNSQGTRIDGGDILKGLPGPDGAVAQSEPPPSRQISLDDGSPLVLDGEVVQIPLDLGRFRTELVSEGIRIFAHNNSGEMKVTEVVRLPIAVITGSGRLLAARNTFEKRSVLELRLAIDEGPLVLSVTSHACQVSEWKIDGSLRYAVKGEPVRIEDAALERLVEISCIG